MDATEDEVTILPPIHPNPNLVSREPEVPSGKRPSKRKGNERYGTTSDEHFMENSTFGLTRLPSPTHSYRSELARASISSIPESRPDSARSTTSTSSTSSVNSRRSTVNTPVQISRPTSRVTSADSKTKPPTPQEKPVRKSTSSDSVRSSNTSLGDALNKSISSDNTVLYDAQSVHSSAAPIVLAEQVKAYETENNVHLLPEERIDENDDLINYESANNSSFASSSNLFIFKDDIEDIDFGEPLDPEIVEMKERMERELDDTMSETSTINSELLEQNIENFYEQNDSIRQGLEEYLQEMKAKKDDDGNSLIDFPPSFDDIVSTFGRDLIDVPIHEVKDLMDANGMSLSQALKEIKISEPQEEWCQRIHRLDIKLQELRTQAQDEIVKRIMEGHEKDKQEREQNRKALATQLREQQQGQTVVKARGRNRSRPENPKRSASTPTPKKKEAPKKNFLDKNKEELQIEDAKFYHLTQEEEQIVERIIFSKICEKVPLGEGYNPSEAEVARLNEISDKLKAILPESKWQDAGLDVKYDGNFEWDNSEPIVGKKKTGIDYLRENRAERLQRKRLKEINQDLTAVYNQEQKMTPQILEELLRQAKEEDEMLKRQAEARSV